MIKSDLEGVMFLESEMEHYTKRVSLYSSESEELALSLPVNNPGKKTNVVCITYLQHFYWTS